MQAMLGAFVSPRVVLGLEISRWTKKQRGADFASLSFGMSAQYYPSQASGFFVRGGFGATELHISGFTSNLDNPNPGGGLGLGVGAGYDMAALRGFSLTPYALVGLGRIGGGSAVHAQAGLAVTYR